MVASPDAGDWPGFPNLIAAVHGCWYFSRRPRRHADLSPAAVSCALLAVAVAVAVAAAVAVRAHGTCLGCCVRSN